TRSTERTLAATRVLGSLTFVGSSPGGGARPSLVEATGLGSAHRALPAAARPRRRRARRAACAAAARRPPAARAPGAVPALDRGGAHLRARRARRARCRRRARARTGDGGAARGAARP